MDELREDPCILDLIDLRYTTNGGEKNSAADIFFQAAGPPP